MNNSRFIRNMLCGDAVRYIKEHEGAKEALSAFSETFGANPSDYRMFVYQTMEMINVLDKHDVDERLLEPVKSNQISIFATYNTFDEQGDNRFSIIGKDITQKELVQAYIFFSKQIYEELLKRSENDIETKSVKNLIFAAAYEATIKDRNEAIGEILF